MTTLCVERNQSGFTWGSDTMCVADGRKEECGAKYGRVAKGITIGGFGDVDVYECLLHSFAWTSVAKSKWTPAYFVKLRTQIIEHLDKYCIESDGCVAISLGNKHILRYGNKNLLESPWEFQAFGSGADYALGAYFPNGSIFEAVAAGIKYDVMSGGEVAVEHFER